MTANPRVGGTAIPAVARPAKNYVGTIVGESTTREFRIAVAQESVREQDIIAVDAELHPTGSSSVPERFRVWAKVQRIERLNPLFPSEAGHELAETRTDPFDTVLSLSREMVTAVCQVLGVEPEEGDSRGKLGQLRYPAKPATSSYLPAKDDLHRVIQGGLRSKEHRVLDIAHLANRKEIDVNVDGHAVVTRHLAILAMTGAGKSWAARRLVEQIAAKEYPMVIFDPHGDYTGLADPSSGLADRVDRYYAAFPVFEEDAATVAGFVSALGYKLTDKMATRFEEVFAAAKELWSENEGERKDRSKRLSELLSNPKIAEYGIDRNLFLVADVAQAGDRILTNPDDADAKEWLAEFWPELRNYNRSDITTLNGIMMRTRKAAAVLRRMELTNKKVVGDALPLPQDRTSIVRDGRVAVVSLGGYTGEFQATIYSMIASEIFEARVQDALKWPVLLVLEEAHNFVPGKPLTEADNRSIAVTKQIAQEGRKFGVGLVLISQRPSRLDETTLSQCNSYIILRMVNPTDQAFVRRVVESLTEDESRLLPSLDVGEALLSGQFVNFPVLAKIKEPRSSGEREETDAFVQLAEIRSTAGADKAPRRRS
jgi:uncharacterized protein